MIDSQGWLDWTIKTIKGPARKTNGGRNTLEGFVPHSAEGHEDHLINFLVPFGPASWTFSNLKDGRCYQHYSVFDQVWTSGSHTANNRFPSAENEGVVGQALTGRQTDNLVRIIKDLVAFTGRTEIVRLPDWRLPFEPNEFVLGEHNECVRAFGGEPTACPSGRIPWEIISHHLQDQGVPAMSQDEINELADRRAFDLVLRELNWAGVGDTGDGLYRTVSIAEEDGKLKIELMRPDRTSYPNPNYIYVRKP